MPGLLADNDVAGAFRALVQHVLASDWREVWLDLNMTVETFESLALARTATDWVLWQSCQGREVVLVTGNRNNKGPDSLETTIREENRPDSLPVITLAKPRRIMRNKEYRERTVVKLLEYLQDIDKCRGAGRLYVP